MHGWKDEGIRDKKKMGRVKIGEKAEGGGKWGKLFSFHNVWIHLETIKMGRREADEGTARYGGR